MDTMKYLRMSIWALASLLMVQCSEEGDKTYPQTPRPMWSAVTEDFVTAAPTDWTIPATGAVEAPNWELDMEGTAEMPQWTSPDNSVYPTSMTAIIRLTPFLEQYVSDDDMMAAFIGNDCRGVADIVKVNGVSLFFIQVKASDDEKGNVSFRYYSKKNKTILTSVAADVPYQVNKVYGTATEPAYPNFEQSCKYPVYMNAVVAIDPASLPFEMQEGDELSAFVEDDCRGVATKLEVANKHLYSMEIRGKKEGEVVMLKYYSAAKKEVYRAEAKVTMEHLATYGTEETPEMLTLVPEFSLTAYLVLDKALQNYASANDQLAAFCGGVCRGVGEVVATNGNARVYKLVVKGAHGQADKIDVKYYAATTKYVYTAASYLTYETEAVHGTPDVPQVVALDQNGKHPLQMNMVLALPMEQAQHASTGDVLAAFVGNECRGVAKNVEKDGEVLFQITVNGSISNDEKITVKYYASNTSYLYAVPTPISFVHGSQYGTLESPKVCSLVISE